MIETGPGRPLPGPTSVPRDPVAYDCRHVGAILVVSLPGGGRGAAMELAGWLPADPARVTVVADIPSAELARGWTMLAAALRQRGPVRLGISQAGTASGDSPAPAQWLAEQLGTEVVAPDGALARVPGGSAFVVGAQGSGCWRVFRPGLPSSVLELRFPAPAWEPMAPRDPWPAGAVGTAEPVPAGIWLHSGPIVPWHGSPVAPLEAVNGDPGPARLARAVFALPCRPDLLTVVLGCPGQPAVPVDEICRLLSAIPAAARPNVRLAPYGPDAGPEPVGQLVADQLGEPVVAYSGLPVAVGSGIEVTAVDAAGQPAWRPFATEVGYLPRTGPDPAAPTVLGLRPPVPGLVAVSPGLFPLAGGAVLEIVPSGLWVRPPAAEPAGVAKVRALPLDPEWVRVTVGLPGQPVSAALEAATRDLVGRLEPDARRLLRLVFSTQEPPVAEPGISSALTVGEPEISSDLTVREPEGTTVVLSRRGVEPPASEPPPSAETARLGRLIVLTGPPPVQRVGRHSAPRPDEPPAAPAAPGQFMVADRDSSAADRDGLCTLLGDSFDGLSSEVVRLLAERPALRAADHERLEAVVTDLVAVQLYLSGQAQEVDAGLRSGQPGELESLVRCVVSGLRRLPVHQGPVLSWAMVNPADWPRFRPGATVLDPTFRHGLTVPAAGPAEAAEFVVWSLTGRVTAAAEPDPDEISRIVFLPGRRFQVLAVTEPPGAALPRVLCRELPDGATLLEPDPTVTAGLAEAVALLEATEPAQRTRTVDPVQFAIGNG